MSDARPVPTQEDADRYFNKHHAKQMKLTLPSTVEEYWNLVDKDVRTQVRKAKKIGLHTVKSVVPHGEEISEIFASWAEKQDRPINTITRPICQALGDWTIEGCWPFTYYPQTEGYVDLFEVRDEDDCTVAFVEFVTSQNQAIVSYTMGHAAFIHRGAMKLLFTDVIAYLIERGYRALYYLKSEYLEKHPERRFFCLDLGFRSQHEA